jgi:hypothetical protein
MLKDAERCSTPWRLQDLTPNIFLDGMQVCGYRPYMPVKANSYHPINIFIAGEKNENYMQINNSFNVSNAVWTFSLRRGRQH